MKRPNLKPWEIEALLAWLNFHVPMEMRIKLSRELPGIYNAMVGSETVRVEWVEVLEEKGLA